MDQQLLERALEASGNYLDSAIRSLNDLHLGSAEINLGFTATKLDASSETNVFLPTEGIMDNNVGDAAGQHQSATDNLPKAGSEWVDLFVREMMSASDVDDARARASRVLGVLEKSIVVRASAEANEGSLKENMMLKEQVELLLRENTILKRAVAIQHGSQQEYAEKNQELQHLKQLVSQYQEQLRTLEVNNYALTVHLKQSQQSSSIPGHFHPDIF